MVETKRVLSFLKWCGTLGFPIPVALAASWSLIHIVGLTFWGAANSWLFDFYNSIGIHGVPYRFSWSWMTIFMMQIALPYSILVLAMRVLLFKRRGRCVDSPLTTKGILKWFGIVLIPAPAVLFIVRVLAILDNWQGGPTPKGEVLSLLELLLLLGFPYAILSLLLHYFLFVRTQHAGTTIHSGQ